MGKELVIVKLGGSLITDKRSARAARLDVIERLAREIAVARSTVQVRLIVGHGSGSFGHVAAAHYKLDEGLIRDGEMGSLDGVGFTQDQAARLHRLVFDSLVRAGARPFSMAPSSAMVATGGRITSALIQPLTLALDLGLLPVLFGDVILDRVLGASICSTEKALTYLLKRLKDSENEVQRILWMGDTDGVYDVQGKTIPRIDRRNYRVILREVGQPAGTDVTGGMLLRLKTARSLARLGIESWLINGTRPGLLIAALKGEPVPGTHFVADKLERARSG